MTSKTFMVAAAITTQMSLAINLAGEQRREGGSGGDGSKRAKGPSDAQWFKSDLYQAQGKEQKLTDLWSILVPDSSVAQTPIPYYWSDWQHTFTQESILSFRTSDEMPEGRRKFAHTQGVVG